MATFLSNLVDNYFEIPIVTRSYLTLCTLTTLAVQFDIVSPFSLYYNSSLIYGQWQLWRLVTTFTYFGSLGISFMFNIIFANRYCRSLEESSFRGRPADFLFMLLFGAFIFMLIAPFVNLMFFSQAFTLMLIYVWSKHNPNFALNFMEVFVFHAPHVPWVMLGMSVLFGSSVTYDLLGIAVGHLYYFFNDVFPTLPGGFPIMITPTILKRLFNQQDPNYQPLNDETNTDDPAMEAPPAAEPDQNQQHPHQD